MDDDALLILANSERPIPDDFKPEQLLALARSAGERAVPALERLTAEPATRLAAVDALGLVHAKSAANVLMRFHDVPVKEIRKAARRSLVRLRSAGIEPDPVVRAAKPESDPILLAYASAFSLQDYTQVVGLVVQRPLGKRQTVSLVRSEIDGIQAIELGESGRTVDDFRRDVAEGILGKVRVPLYELPIPYVRSLIRRSMRLNSSTGQALPADMFEIADLFPASDAEVPAPITEVIRPIEVKFSPDLLEHSGRLLDEPEAVRWAFDPRRIAPIAQLLQESERSSLMLGPDAAKARDAEILGSAHRLLYTPADREAFRHVLEETAWAFYQTDRLLSARRAVAAALELVENPESTSPLTRMVLAYSVTVALGGAPNRKADAARPSGLWVPG